MSVTEALLWVLRGFGALYLVGGVIGARQAWFWARITPDMDRLTRTLEAFSAEMGERNQPAADMQAESDRGRYWWILIGAAMVSAAGAAMLLAHQSAVWLLTAITVHQMLYFVRQRRRELAATTPEAAADARPERSTINGFFWGAAMAVLAAWLHAQGMLW